MRDVRHHPEANGYTDTLYVGRRESGRADASRARTDWATTSAAARAGSMAGSALQEGGKGEQERG